MIKNSTKQSLWLQKYFSERESMKNQAKMGRIVTSMVFEDFSAAAGKFYFKKILNYPFKSRNFLMVAKQESKLWPSFPS